ncbi:MAG TPA: hypothetical protein VG711_02730 [Phycisphaerales bacterium]|nr:hypothetical protein [Phycisphaerales bacterium]
MLLIPYGLCVVALFAGVGFLLLRAWLLIPRRSKTLCPGPRRRWWVWGLPFAWVYRRPCGYDLRGQTAGASGCVRCPECGSTITRRQMRRHLVRIRPFTAGVLFTLTGWYGLHTEGLQLSKVVVDAPTTALIVVEKVLAGSTPREVRSEISERIRTTTLTPWEARHEAESLVNDLRDDDVWGNSARATPLLMQLGDAANPILERALLSEDYQQRQFAAEVLRARVLYQPSSAMIRACVEGLQDDHLGNYNASEGVTYLIKHIDCAKDELRSNLNSKDWQEQLLCAAILGCARQLDCVDEAMPILITHLSDNHIQNDAVVARTAVNGFGESARPYLERAIQSDDAQLRRNAKTLIKWLDDEAKQPSLEPDEPLFPDGVYLLYQYNHDR